MKHKSLLLLAVFGAATLSLASCSQQINPQHSVITGPQGEKGETGDTGPQGPAGEDGKDGQDGEDGQDGATWLTGTTAPTSEQGKDGDLYLNTTTLDVYQKKNGAWSIVTNIKGDKGETGEQGPAGDKGETGDKGDQGEQGPQGDKGDKGDQGEQGPAGEDGKDGIGIKSIVKTSSEGNVDTYTITYTDDTTSTFTVTNGEDGKTPTIEIDEETNHWIINGKDTGIPATGPKGDPGSSTTVTNKITIGENGNWFIDGEDTEVSAKGEKGEQGEKGEPGEDGEDGATWLTGATAPTSEQGKDGDLYLDTTTYNLYQKQSGEWKLLCNIKGETGEAGQDGEKGEQGETGEQGPQGDKGDKGDQGEQGPAGEDGKDGQDGATAWSNTMIPSADGYVTVDKGSAIVGEDITFTAIPYDINTHVATHIILNGESHEVDGEGKVTVKMVANGYVAQGVFEEITILDEAISADINTVLGLSDLSTEKTYKNLYSVTGVWTGTTNSEFGNGSIVDLEDPSKELNVYGLTSTDYLDKITYSNEAYSFSNPKNFSSTLDEQMVNGALVTIVGIPYMHNSKPQIQGIVSNITAPADYEVAITYPETANGSVTGVNTTHYGDTVEFTVQPDEGYVLSELKVNNGNNLASSLAEGKISYQVSAFGNLSISASFVEEGSVTEETIVAKYDFANGTGIKHNTAEINATTLKTIFDDNKNKEEGDGSVTGITEISKYYSGESGYLKFGMKVGTGSAGSSLTLTLDQEITKVRVYTVGWKTSDKIGISTSGTPTNFTQMSSVAYNVEGCKAEEHLFELGLTKTVHIETQDRGFITAIEFIA